MNGFIRLLVISALVASLTSCASRSTSDDDLSLDTLGGGSDEFAMGSEDSSSAPVEEAPAASNSGSGDDFADFEEPAPAKQAENTAPATEQKPAGQDEFDQFEDNQQVAEQAAPPAEPQTANDVAVEDPFAEAPKDVPAETPPPQMAEAISEPTPTPEPAPVFTQSAVMANITDLRFKANENGGTIVVQGDHPLTYTTRSNPELRQYIIEVENANLPERLKRSLNTKDIKGSVGAIDAYQSPGSSTARIVIQLREGVLEPAVQSEGNSLLIVASGATMPTQAEANQAIETSTADGMATAAAGSGTGVGEILPSQNFAEFMAGNTKFYGKKISIETNNMNVRDALNFITEESGMNMVIADDITGTVNLKLRQVPWDQALVVLMKAKKLGYTRSGNVLRIAQLAELKSEEEAANKLAADRKVLEPLKVRMFPVSYAKVADLEKRVQPFLGERGKVAGDTRMNALVVTDIQENLDRVAKLISSLDQQPAQVLIESKIVEASEEFTRQVGVSWSSSGAPISLGSGPRGPVNMNPSFGVNPAGRSASGTFNFNLSVGTLDVFGTLAASLAINEQESLVKVISSPRILILTNDTGTITQTTEVPVRQVTQNGTATQETFSFKPLTMKLEVTPQITADGSVIMKVEVARQFKGADVSSAGQGAFAVNSREAKTNVLVKNGATAVIGGIYQSDATDGETGVPWFRELPVFGALFKSKNVTKNKSELLVFLTPRIMNQIEGAGSTSSTSEL